MLFIHLGDLHVGVHLRNMGNLAVSLLIETLSIGWFVKGIFPLEPCIASIQSRPVPII